jgi:trimethylamine:corrinoid methyltransferase-like protein
VREDWAASGSTDLYTRARAKANEILQSHHPEPLPAEVAAEVRAIVVGAERELGVAGTV